MRLTLIDKKILEKDIYLFTFKPEKPLVWQAGQQISFTLPHANPDLLGVCRMFSIASAPFEKNIMVLTHCGVESSTFKKALKEMKIGSLIEAGTPFGKFIITNPENEHTLIAAGVGIAPYRSMLMELEHQHLPINIMLIYSHVSASFPFKEEIEKLRARNVDLKVFYAVEPNKIDHGKIKEIIGGLENHPIYMSGVYIRKIATMLDYEESVSSQIEYEEERMGERQSILQ